MNPDLTRWLLTASERDRLFDAHAVRLRPLLLGAFAAALLVAGLS